MPATNKQTVQKSEQEADSMTRICIVMKTPWKPVPYYKFILVPRNTIQGDNHISDPSKPKVDLNDNNRKL